MAIQIWQAGDKIKGDRFEILRPLGKGGFGISYLVQDHLKQQQVVLKTLNAERQDADNFEETQERFVNEGLTLRAFDSPHIVKVYELVQMAALWGLVMEHIDGVDLDRHTQAQGKLQEDEALGYIDQMAQALAVVHEGKFFHRDVKPGNIMLRKGQRSAVLIDFGLAREYLDEKSVKLSSTAGTPVYQPVEQYKNKGKFGPYTDVYALAVTLYYLLAGGPPGGDWMSAISYTSIVRQNNRKRGVGGQMDAPLWEELESLGVSTGTIAAIQKGMAVEPQERPQTMLEFRKLLRLVKSQFGPQQQVAVGPITPVSAVVPVSKLIVKEKVPQPQGKPTDKRFDFETAQVIMTGGVLGFGKKVKIVRHKSHGEYYQENLGNGVTLNMVKIPAGQFTRGDQHVKVPEFYLGQTLITQLQWQLTMGSNPSHFKGSDKLPIESVSWLDAMEFCDKLSKKTRRTYRLPSEAEWEYACRAGTTTPFAFGETITPEIVNYNGNHSYAGEPKGECRQKTTEVASFPANSFGLHDMHGNLLEWCLDEWFDSYNDAPIDSSPRGDIKLRSKNGNRVLRGGSWSYFPSGCCSDYRFRFITYLHNNAIGFRVVYAPARLS